MERYCRWFGQRVATGLERGLAGEELRRTLRAEFEAQCATPRAMQFAITWKGALEDAVEAAEMAARGEPLYRQIELANIDMARQ